MNSSHLGQGYSWVKERATQPILWLTYNCGTKSTHKHSYTSDIRSDYKIMSFQLDLYQELSSQIFFFCVCVFTYFKHCLKWHQLYDHVFGLSKTHLCVCLFHVCWYNYWASYKYKSCKARYLANIDPHANSRTVNPMPPRSWYTYNCNQTGCRRVFLIQIGAWGQVDQILCW